MRSELIVARHVSSFGNCRGKTSMAAGYKTRRDFEKCVSREISKRMYFLVYLDMVVGFHEK